MAAGWPTRAALELREQTHEATVPFQVRLSAGFWPGARGFQCAPSVSRRGAPGTRAGAPGLGPYGCRDRGVPIAMLALGLSGRGEFGAVLCSQSPPHLATHWQWHVGRPALPVTVRTGTSASPRIRRVLSDNDRGCFLLSRALCFQGARGPYLGITTSSRVARRCFDHRGPAGTLALDWGLFQMGWFCH